MAIAALGGSATLRRGAWVWLDAHLCSSCVRRKIDSSLALRRPFLQQRGFRLTSWLREEEGSKNRGSFSTRLGKAWRNTKVEWYPIPVGLGIGFLGIAQFWRIRRRERKREKDAMSAVGDGVEEDTGSPKKPRKRERVRPSGPWQVQVMSTLPLKAISRLWGRFNEISIPYYLRVPGFKLYGWIFGVNFDEISEPDLHVYPNLASFFYRTLKPGVRPLDPNPNAILSPADGKILSFGTIEQGEVEQVKGITYSLDALLGKVPPGASPSPSAPSNNLEATASSTAAETARAKAQDDPTTDHMTADQEFANMNGISYTLPNLFSGQNLEADSSTPTWPSDASTTPRPSSEAEVRADLALSPRNQPWWSPFSTWTKTTNPTQLHYLVIYLAPGDYHRFHSPVSWVCTSRRHFAGDLYSVSPYLQRTLPGLFTLNERVVLLGRWKHGFFSYVPVGATNVGSIKINFDAELRTNSLTTDTAADRDAADAADHGQPYSGFSEATYANASALLGGHALRRGEEMGGFQLGSSIVLVFEAPQGRRKRDLDQGGLDGGEKKGAWLWQVEKGQKVKMGQALGWVEGDGH